MPRIILNLDKSVGYFAIQDTCVKSYERYVYDITWTYGHIVIWHDRELSSSFPVAMLTVLHTSHLLVPH
jgi:hypothetical protein